MNKARVRFAPSPTGYLHIGGLRSALYNFLFAKQNDGDFILRVEDTDQKRYIKDALVNLIKSLDWAGISYDEGIYLEGDLPAGRQGKILQKGKFGPYVQSERLEIYNKYAEKLVKEKKAYYCFCTPERLEKMRNDQISKKLAPKYDKYCLNSLREKEVNKKLEESCPCTIRLKVPKNGTIEFNDIVRGKVKFESDNIDDQILLKSDGYPTYHLANVVDDHLMQISHVIRGEEWLSSTPKHILLYKAFGWDVPQFAHLPLILTKEKKKLSKRTGDVSVDDYIKKGYLKEAIINFVVFLGWNPGKGSTQEIFSLEDLIKKFDLAKVHKGGAVFDLDKFDWINSKYIKKLSVDELYNKAIEFLKEKDFYKNADGKFKEENYVKKVFTIEQERLNKLSEVGESNKFFFKDVNYDKELLRWKDMTDDKLKHSLQISKKVLQENNWENLGVDVAYNVINTGLNKYLSPVYESNEINILKSETVEEWQGFKAGELYWPLRVALTGEKKSPPPGEVAWALGKGETIRRVDKAIEKL